MSVISRATGAPDLIIASLYPVPLFAQSLLLHVSPVCVCLFMATPVVMDLWHANEVQPHGDIIISLKTLFLKKTSF